MNRWWSRSSSEEKHTASVGVTVTESGWWFITRWLRRLVPPSPDLAWFGCWWWWSLELSICGGATAVGRRRHRHHRSLLTGVELNCQSDIASIFQHSKQHSNWTQQQLTNKRQNYLLLLLLQLIKLKKFAKMQMTQIMSANREVINKWINTNELLATIIIIICSGKKHSAWPETLPLLLFLLHPLPPASHHLNQFSKQLSSNYHRSKALALFCFIGESRKQTNKQVTMRERAALT